MLVRFGTKSRPKFVAKVAAFSISLALFSHFELLVLGSWRAGAYRLSGRSRCGQWLTVHDPQPATIRNKPVIDKRGSVSVHRRSSYRNSKIRWVGGTL